MSIEVGGRIAVDTEEMLRAAAVLADAGAALRTLSGRTAQAAQGTSARLVAQLTQARDLMAAAERQTMQAADALRVAAMRYGLVEHGIAQAQQRVFAEAAALEGTLIRVFGPAGAVVVTGGEALAAAPLLLRLFDGGGLRDPGELAADPVLIRWLQLRIGSLDDTLRGLLGVQTPLDVMLDRPDSLFGTAAIATAIGALVWNAPPRPIAVERRTTAPVTRPRSLADLVDRLPDDPAAQVRVERYPGAGGTRWIVYSAGTIDFGVERGPEPFDLESDVRGVGHGATDAQRAVLEAMRQAGVERHDPVLLVGHSQGALNAIRIAQHGGYAVQGVVELGGPTGQIPAPPGVPVLAVEHTQDLVPALGGLTSTAPGTVRIRRSLPEPVRAPGPPTGTAIDGFAAHDRRHYRDTMRQTEALKPARVMALRQQWSGFFDGAEGTVSRYRATRLPAPAPAAVSGPRPSPTAGAAPVPPASR